MANKKSVGHAYNVDFLNVVFAASSLFLFFDDLLSSLMARFILVMKTVIWLF